MMSLDKVAPSEAESDLRGKEPRHVRGAKFLDSDTGEIYEAIMGELPGSGMGDRPLWLRLSDRNLLRSVDLPATLVMIWEPKLNYEDSPEFQDAVYRAVSSVLKAAPDGELLERVAQGAGLDHSTLEKRAQLSQAVVRQLSRIFESYDSASPTDLSHPGKN